MITKGNFPSTFFYHPRGKAYETVDAPKYHVLPIPNCGLKILIKAEFQIASDKLTFIEKLKYIIEETYHVPGNPASDGDLDLEEIGWGGGVNDETENMLVVHGEGRDEGDHAIDYIHNDAAVASKMAGNEQ